jgi:hypothetical protein
VIGYCIFTRIGGRARSAAVVAARRPGAGPVPADDATNTIDHPA